ncbi:MAG: helix-turn-helix domain-containing protein [Zoogloeaceae bacterium]|nr:helix-turn-helix domain-containing protein [Zoogloeaceae bacterium]
MSTYGGHYFGPNAVKASDVVDRLALVYGADSDADLARHVGTTRSTVNSWRTRDSVPFAICVQTAEERGVSLDWLLMARGQMTRATIPGATVRGAVREALATPDPDLARLLVWIEEWWTHAVPRERTWLLVQLERCLPEYAAWLAEQQGSAGHYSHGSGGKS